MTPKTNHSRSSRAPKITDKDIELLLKKGILGILDDQEDSAGEAHTMDIDELIRNSKTTNYSMINDKYTITRMNVDTDKKEQKVDIDDPDFWKKVLKDEQTPGKLLLAEFTQLKENNDFMDEEAQHEFFVRLNNQIYSYVEKAKTGEVNYEEEEIYFKILQQVVDDPFVREDLKTVSTLLMGDIRKKPRRLKRRDISGRKRSSKKTKKARAEDPDDSGQRKSKRRGPDEEDFVVEVTAKEAKKRDSKRKKSKSRALGKRAKLEDEGVYRHSESEDNELMTKRKKRKPKARPKRKKTGKMIISCSDSKSSGKKQKTGNEKKLKRVKKAERGPNMNAPICIFCRDSRPLQPPPNMPSAGDMAIEMEEPTERVVKCEPCKRSLHPSCLEKHLKALTRSSNIEPAINLKSCLENPDVVIFDHDSKSCLNCRVGLTECFVCQNVGQIKEKVDVRVQNNVREAILNSSRSMQRNDSSAFLFEELGRCFPQNPTFRITRRLG